jgi:hypothetical protein
MTFEQITTLLNEWREEAQRIQPDPGDAKDAARSKWQAFFNLWTRGRLDAPDRFNYLFRQAYTTGIIDFYQFVMIHGYIDAAESSDPEGRELLRDIPESVKVFRGTCSEELKRGILGPSWTLDRGAAEYFAFGTDDPGHRVVLSALVPKNDILAVFAIMLESEVLALVNAEDAAVIADAPTAAMDEYITKRDNYQKDLEE